MAPGETWVYRAIYDHCDDGTKADIITCHIGEIKRDPDFKSFVQVEFICDYVYNKTEERLVEVVPYSTIYNFAERTLSTQGDRHRSVHMAVQFVNQLYPDGDGYYIRSYGHRRGSPKCALFIKSDETSHYEELY